MMIYFILGLSILFNIIFFVIICVAAYYLYRFAKVIFATEDAITHSLEVFNDANNRISEILKMEIFIESKEVKRSVEILIDTIKLSQLEISEVIKNFTSISKKKYNIVVPDEE